MAEKIFFGENGTKKGAKVPFLGSLRLAGWVFPPLLGRLYYNSFRGVQSGVNYVFSERFHRGGGRVVGLQHFRELCARVLSDFWQVVFFRRECLCYSVHHCRASFLKNVDGFGFYDVGGGFLGGFFLRFCRLAFGRLGGGGQPARGPTSGSEAYLNNAGASFSRQGRSRSLSVLI